MKKYLPILLLTLVSGFLSEYTGTHGSIISKFFSAYITDVSIYMPGIIFGLIVGVYFLITQKSRLFKVIIWLGTSVLAYYLAMLSAIIFATPQVGTYIFAFIVAGSVGATILTISTHFLIRKLNMEQIFIVMLAGALAGLIFGYFINLESYGGPYLAYIIWQMAVGITLGVMVDRNKISQSLPVNNN
jgi:hypothetical protein